MSLRWFAMLLSFGAAAVVCLAAEAHEVPVDPKHVARLIAQLGSEEYAEREKASRALDDQGASGLEALRQASRSEDPEVRRHARELVTRIEKRIETARLLAPRRLRLVYHDTLLTEAVADFAKKTGTVLQLDGDPARYTDRKLTLDTGETTFWPALDLFCARAGLVASVTAAAQPSGGGRPGTMANRNPARDVLRPPTPDGAACRVLLTEAKQPALPTHTTGSLRLRVLPADAALPGQGPVAGETLLTLELTAEPGLLCQKVFGVRIHQAVDDQGQPLAQRLAPSAGKRQDFRVMAMAMVNARGPLAPPMPAPELELLGFPPALVPLCLQRGERPARTLQELSGTVVTLVQSPPQILATVDQVLKAAGQTVPGPDGSWVKLIEVSRLENRQVKLLIQAEPPASPGSMGVAGRLINKQGLKAVDPDVILTAQNFVLLDPEGRPFEAIKAINTVRGSAQQLELIYQPAQAQGEAARFIYTGPRSTVVEVPFRFANLPLPSKDEPKP